MKKIVLTALLVFSFLSPACAGWWEGLTFEDTLTTTELHERRIHQGTAWSFTYNYGSLSDGATFGVAIITGANQPHVNFVVTSSGNGKVALVEAPNTDDGNRSTGARVSLNQCNTITATTTTQFVVSGVTRGLDVATIYDVTIAGGSGVAAISGSGGSRNEIILDANSTYYLQYTNLAGAAAVAGVSIEWSEE